MNKECTIGFLMGLGAGVAVGFLCAPKAGEDTRRAITDAACQKAQNVKQRATELMDSATGMVEQTKAGVLRTHEGLKNAAEAGRKAYQETMS